MHKCKSLTEIYSANNLNNLYIAPERTIVSCHHVKTQYPQTDPLNQ